MLTNIPTCFRMLADSNFRRFLKKLRETVPASRNGSKGKSLALIHLFLKGEKILKFENKYVVISLLPPLGSESFLQFIRTQGRNIFARGKPLRMAAPISLSLAMTNRCNYDCAHCGVNLKNRVKEMSTGEWIKIIRTLLDMGSAYFALTGGEPLIRNDMEEIISEGFDQRGTTYLFSNGKVLTRARARSLKKAGLFGLCISLDSVNPEIHNRMRGDDKAFDHSLAAIANARAAGLYTLAQACVYKNQLNRRELFKLAGLAKNQGAHEFRIMKPARAGTLINCVEEGIFYDEEDDEFVRRFQYAANRRWDMPKVTVFPFSEIGKFNCNAGVRHSYITAKGDWTPCDFIPMSFGNVLEEDMHTIWRRMNKAVGVCKKRCWSGDLAPYLRDKCWPLKPDESVKITRKFSL